MMDIHRISLDIVQNCGQCEQKPLKLWITLNLRLIL